MQSKKTPPYISFVVKFCRCWMLDAGLRIINRIESQLDRSAMNFHSFIKMKYPYCILPQLHSCSPDKQSQLQLCSSIIIPAHQLLSNLYNSLISFQALFWMLSIGPQPVGTKYEKIHLPIPSLMWAERGKVGFYLCFYCLL